MSSIAIVTHEAVPDGVPDDLVLAETLTSLGAEPRMCVWNAPDIDWSEADLVVVRSVWDYYKHPEAWFKWLEDVCRVTILVNEAPIQTWNSEKTYLLDLLASGIPVVPTCEITSTGDLIEACAKEGWNDVVIKPAIGASSFGTRRFVGDEIAAAGADHYRTLARSTRVLLQPFQKSLESERERSLVFIEGNFCHAYSKPPFNDDLGNSQLAVHEASEQEIAIGHQVLEALPAQPLIARVDLIPSDNGPLVMEAELIEPELALHLGGDTAEILARALVQLVDRDD